MSNRSSLFLPLSSYCRAPEFTQYVLARLEKFKVLLQKSKVTFLIGKSTCVFYQNQLMNLAKHSKQVGGGQKKRGKLGYLSRLLVCPPSQTYHYYCHASPSPHRYALRRKRKGGGVIPRSIQTSSPPHMLF